MIHECGLLLHPCQWNALERIHGEGDTYRKDRRAAWPLAAFCHALDFWSARGWYDEPLASGHLPNLMRG